MDKNEAIPVVVNGEGRGATVGDTIETFLRHLGLDPDVVVVERNGAIVPRKAWAGTALEPRDELEIVHFVGGG